MIDLYGKESASATSATLLFSSLPVITRIGAGNVDGVWCIDPSSGAVAPVAPDRFVTAGSLVEVRGWAIDLEAGGVASGVVVRFGGRVFEADYGEPRDDIATSYSGGFRRSGFRAVFVARESGSHSIEAFAVDATATALLRLEATQHMIVREGSLRLRIALPQRPGSAHIHVDGITADDGIERPPGEVLAPSGSTVVVRGWAIDRSTSSSPRALYALFGDQQIVRGVFGRVRPDIAAAFDNPSALASGFELRLETAALPPGLHEAQLAIVTADGEAYDVARTPLTLIVTSKRR